MNYFVWDISPIIFELPLFIGSYSFPIRWYSLCFAIGIFGSFMILRSMFLKENKPLAALETLPIYIVLATVIGARLGHTLLYNPQTYLADPLRLLRVWEGGLASHGGFFFVIMTLIIFARKHRASLSFFWLADRCAICAMFAAGCIRIGNFFNSEIIGLTTDVPWAVIFSRVDRLPRHPTQIYESLGYFYIFLAFYLFYRYKGREIGEGRFFGAILISGFAYRFLIEMFKENHKEFVRDLPMNMGQMLSIPFIVLGLYFLVGLHQKSKTWRWALSSDSASSTSLSSK